MASLRGVGAGLQAVAESLGPDIQDAIVRRRQAAQNKVIAEREATAAMLRDKIAALSNKDPEVRQRLSTAFPQMGIPQPSQSEMSTLLSAQIGKASNLSELQTPQDIAGSLPTTPASDVAPGDTTTPSTSLDTGPQARTQSILSLLTQNQAKKDSLMAGMNATRQNEPLTQDYYDEQGVKMQRQTTKGAAETTNPVQVEPTGVQAGQRKKEELIGGDLNPDITALKANQAGAETTARATAEQPFQMRLAQMRANTSLLAQKEMDDYRKAHPGTPQQTLVKQSNASQAIIYIDYIEPMLDQMDAKGMLGPIASQASNLASGKIKSEALFPNPEDAALAAEFFSSMRYLSSAVAVAHGGARGGGSPAMSKLFEQIINGMGDKSLTQGQLNATRKLMEIYKSNPNAPDNLMIPDVAKYLNAPPKAGGNPVPVLPGPRLLGR